MSRGAPPLSTFLTVAVGPPSDLRLTKPGTVRVDPGYAGLGLTMSRALFGVRFLAVFGTSRRDGDLGMATKIVTELHDDIDGSDATQTGRFAASSMRLIYPTAMPTGYATALASSSATRARQAEGTAVGPQHPPGPAGV